MHWTSMKSSGHLSKYLNITEHLWKSPNNNENVLDMRWTSMKISGHLWQSLNIAEPRMTSLPLSKMVLENSRLIQQCE